MNYTKLLNGQVRHNDFMKRFFANLILTGHCIILGKSVAIDGPQLCQIPLKMSGESCVENRTKIQEGRGEGGGGGGSGDMTMPSSGGHGRKAQQQNSSGSIGKHTKSNQKGEELPFYEVRNTIYRPGGKLFHQRLSFSYIIVFLAVWAAPGGLLKGEVETGIYRLPLSPPPAIFERFSKHCLKVWFSFLASLRFVSFRFDSFFFISVFKYVWVPCSLQTNSVREPSFIKFKCTSHRFRHELTCILS